MRKATMLGCVGLAAFVALGAGDAEIKNGAGGAGSGKVVGSAEVRVESAGGIDFDDVTAPCGFYQAVALQSYGDATFAGPGGLNGGAILDQCGNFSVTGFSPPNFLAFNCGSLLSDGGIPTVSEFVTFSSEVTNLSLKVGSAAWASALVTFIATGSDGAAYQVQYVRVGPNMNTVHFKIPVQQVEIWSDNACTLVLDDFTWE